MKIVRFAFAALVLCGVAGLALVAQQLEGTGARQVAAAQDLLNSLKPEQKKQATFAFDDKERFDWNFIPLQDSKTRKYTRKGLPMEEMTAEQKMKAIALLKSGTSDAGAETAQLIMSLEAILKEAEKDKGAMVRNPLWYFVSIFGEPGKTGNWGWRIEGHHLSINSTLEGTKVVSSTPFFFGANPAVIKFGPKEGTKVLGPAQDLAAKLYASLDEDQKKAASREKPFPEPGQKEPNPKVGAPMGVAASKMTGEQKKTLVALLNHYVDRMPKDVADREMKAVEDAGIDNIVFGFQGGTKEGEGRSYRIHGPTFVVEFLNIQSDGHGNSNNHIHSSWRRIKGDFGVGVGQ